MHLQFWMFLFYSFFGFILEVLYVRIIKGDKPDRKCMLVLPLCPVYGIGALLLISLPQAIQSSLILFPLASIAVCTCTEYCMGAFYHRVLKVRFWDYRSARFQLHGHVCIFYAVIWGVLGAAMIYVIHPILLPLLLAIPEGWALPTFYALLLDMALSFALLHHFQTTDILRWYRRLPLFQSNHGQNKSRPESM